MPKKKTEQTTRVSQVSKKYPGFSGLKIEETKNGITIDIRNVWLNGGELMD